MIEAPVDYQLKYEELFINYQKVLHELDQLKRLVFGPRHERFVPATPQEQLALALGTQPPPPTDAAAVERIEYTRNKKETTQKIHTGRMKLPADLPREQVVIEPKEDVSGLKKIGEEITSS